MTIRDLGLAGVEGVGSVESTPPPNLDPTSRAGVSAADVGRLLARWTVVIGYVVMVALFAILKPETFLTTGTLTTILDQATVPAVLVCGLTLVVAAGEFDLSFSALLGLCAGIVMALMAKNGFPVVAAILICLAAAAVIGYGVGALVALGRGSSFIVTLALSSVIAGLEIAITGNNNIFRNIPKGYLDFGSGKLLGLHYTVWVMFAVVAIGAVVLHASRFGRHVSSTGENPTAAYLAGVRVRRVRILCFVALASLAGLAAIILSSTAASYYPGAGTPFLLNSYAAVFLGAAVSRYGRFSIGGSVFGVLWLLTLQTGLTQLNQPAWASTLLQGVVLACAVLIAFRGRREV